MSYLYDSSGSRVIRQKADIANSVDDIVQDLYIGSYERRGVQLQNTLQQPQSIYDFSGSVVSFNDVEGSRLVKYVSGMRVQWKVEEGESSINLSDTPQMFLSFSNHLGSTSAVVDYADGALVEWNALTDKIQ